MCTFIVVVKLEFINNYVVVNYNLSCNLNIIHDHIFSCKSKQKTTYSDANCYIPIMLVIEVINMVS
jgi:hypothetical protein